MSTEPHTRHASRCNPAGDDLLDSGVQQIELRTGADLEGQSAVALFDELGRYTAAARE